DGSRRQSPHMWSYSRPPWRSLSTSSSASAKALKLSDSKEDRDREGCEREEGERCDVRLALHTCVHKRCERPVVRLRIFISHHLLWDERGLGLLGHEAGNARRSRGGAGQPTFRDGL